MINSIEEYLSELKKLMVKCDRATIQDALSDAEEYLRNALESATKNRPDISETEVLPTILKAYGTPEEIAGAYKKIEAHGAPKEIAAAYEKIEYRSDSALPRTHEQGRSSWISRIFGIVIDPRSWGALLYLFFALLTGILYFTWTVTGISLSLGLLVLVIGIPVAGLFMFSTRGIALLEGRLVEALLGIRMPHRQIFSSKNQGLWSKFKTLISDKYTWFTMLYMLLQLPLGIIYFSVFITLIAASLFLVASPVWQLVLDLPVSFSNGMQYYFADWFLPVAVLAGVLLFVLTMHLAKYTGKIHGKLAKAMLVRD